MIIYMSFILYEIKKIFYIIVYLSKNKRIIFNMIRAIKYKLNLLLLKLNNSFIKMLYFLFKSKLQIENHYIRKYKNIKVNQSISYFINKFHYLSSIQ